MLGEVILGKTPTQCTGGGQRQTAMSALRSKIVVLRNRSEKLLEKAFRLEKLEQALHESDFVRKYPEVAEELWSLVVADNPPF